jgi:hypothetical protein
MKKYEECDKELHILQGYRHPALGKNFSVCGKSFDKINEDMERWSKNISDKPDLQIWFSNLWSTKQY